MASVLTLMDAKKHLQISVDSTVDDSEMQDFLAAAETRLSHEVGALVPTTFTEDTLDVVLEDTLDGANWNVIGTFTQRTAAGHEVINVTTPFTDRLRARWTIGGTPAPTFSVDVYSE